jgi:cytochrome c biogenesis protein CcdA
VIEMTNTNQSQAFKADQQKRNAAKYGTAGGFAAAWAPCILGFVVAGPICAIGGALIGDKLARAIDLGNPNGKYTDE